MPHCVSPAFDISSSASSTAFSQRPLIQAVVLLSMQLGPPKAAKMTLELGREGPFQQRQ